MTKTVPLHGAKAAGRVALVDDEDYDLVMQYRWSVQETSRPGRRNGPYAATWFQKDGRITSLGMHNLIMGRPWIDHIDHNTLNNQRSNLRPATAAQNTYHSRPRTGTSSPYKGVHWSSRDQRWQARIKKQGRTTYLGNFTIERNAALAYDIAARKLFGEYAVLNFPEIQIEAVSEPRPERVKEDRPKSLSGHRPKKPRPKPKNQGYLWMQAALKKRQQGEAA